MQLLPTRLRLVAPRGFCGPHGFVRFFEQVALILRIHVASRITSLDHCLVFSHTFLKS